MTNDSLIIIFINLQLTEAKLTSLFVLIFQQILQKYRRLLHLYFLLLLFNLICEYTER